MSQLKNERVSGLASTEDNNTHNRRLSRSSTGSNSGSDSDSDSFSSSYSSGNSSHERSRSRVEPEIEQDDGNARDAHSSSHDLGNQSGLPPTAAAAQEDTKTNGYSENNDETDVESDSKSGTDSESNNEDDEDEQDNSKSQRDGKSRSRNTTNTTSSSNNTKADEEEEEEEEEEEDPDSAASSSNDEDDNAMQRKQQKQRRHSSSSARSDNDTSNAHDEEEDDEEDAASGSAATDATHSQSSSSSAEDSEEDYQPGRAKRTARKPANQTEKTRKSAKQKRNQNWRSDEESDVTDDNSDASSRPAARKRTNAAKNSKAAQQRRKKAHNSSDDSEEDSKRFGKRRAAAAVSYKEQSEDDATESEDLLDVDFEESQAAAAEAEEEDKSETIERIIARRRGRKGCTGNQTTIYAMEENGCDPNDGVDETDLANTEEQFLIKWKGWSHIHNTWETVETLREQKAKGLKKLDNFIRKEQETEYWRRHIATPEDIDYFECQLELQTDLLKSYNYVDRIIARNEKAEGASEYLCKWQSLPYAEATWEDAQLVMRKWQRCVEHFNEREVSKCTPSKHSKVLKYRPKFYKLKEQPDFLTGTGGLTLRDYQMDGLNWLLHSWCKDNSVILADEMGLGKTIQTICFLYSLFKLHHLYGPFLCVVPLSTMTAWQREFDLWAAEMNVVTYLGDVKSREMIRQYEWQFDGSKRLKFNCILTTYEIVLKDKFFLGSMQWAALLVDEAHRLKNDDSLLYKSLKEFDTNHRLLITGTPLQNSLKELWALLHFIMPEKFLTWEDFERDHGDAADKGYAKLHQQLEPFILRRVKKDVEKSLPAKVEQILRVEMTLVQKQIYKLILTKNYDALRKGKKGSTSSFLNIVIELKKCCNHAALIQPTDFEIAGMQQEEALQTLLKGSGKLVLLDKLLCRLKETGHRVLIFSQMVRMLDVLADYLQKRHFSFQRLDGSIKGEMRRQALDHFNAEGSQDFCFLLSTRAGGLGINLATADTVIIFDSDWNPQNDLQAQARAHRIGQKNQVNIYRLVTARSVEEQIVERAKQKMVLDHLVIQRMDTTGRTVLDKNASGSSNATPFNKDDLNAILKFGAEELFKDEVENDDELVCDIDEILRRAETRNEDPEMPGDNLLSAFKVASIAAFEEEPDVPRSGADENANAAADEDDTKDWDDIIPADFRKIVEDQERAKEMEDLYLPPRRKTAAAAAKQATKGGKKAKPDSDVDSDYEAGSDGSGEDGRPKKRGRPTMKEKIIGFTDAEIRRFIRSYKKFPAPLMRLEAIACDAELQEKPLAELKRIGEMLHDRCVQFLEEQTAAAAATPVKNANANTEDGKRKVRATYSVKLGGVSFNAKTLLSCEEELKPLNEIIPSTLSERNNWLLDIKTRPVNFDVEWTAEEDSRLLCGIYQYGIGSWEQMKMDPSLKLTEKMLLNDGRKPQVKHLQSRAEYLLKIIKKNVELKKGLQRKQRKPRKTKEAKSKATVPCTPEKSRLASESQDNHAVTTAAVTNETTSERKQRNRDSISKAEDTDAASNDVEATTAATAANASSVKPKKKRATTKKESGGKSKKSSAADASNKPMHFTANNEPQAVDVLGDLDPTVFNECKEMMRPCKKALKALDKTENLSKDHQRECLLEIGRRIDECLLKYKESEKKEWRSNLWYFVSKFTEHDAKTVFKIYKLISKQPNEDGKLSKSSKKTASPVKAANKELQLNGAMPAEKEKSKKKKKLKDKDKDKEKEKAERGDKQRVKQIEKSERFSKPGKQQRNRLEDAATSGATPTTPIKRKREDNDLASIGIGSNNRGTLDVTKMGSFKRSNMDRNRDRSDERSKRPRDDYYADASGSRDRRSDGMNRALPGTTRVPPMGVGYAAAAGETRNLSPYGDAERWAAHPRDRSYGADYKRERYDNYNARQSAGGGGGAGAGYHREPRDRERERDRRGDKRRYALPHAAAMGGYASHYQPPPGYYMPNGAVLAPPSLMHARYPPDWSRERLMDFPPDYRRSSDYERRQQT